MSGGRYFNIFSYDTPSKATGHWGEACLSSVKTKGIAASANACNGELLLVKAHKNGRPTHLLLQSVPLGPERAYVGIFYKELKSESDYSIPQNIANNWEGCYKLSDTHSAYSTLIPDQDGNILFFMEENALQNHYDIVFNKLTLSEKTNHIYQ